MYSKWRWANLLVACIHKCKVAKAFSLWFKQSAVTELFISNILII